MRRSVYVLLCTCALLAAASSPAFAQTRSERAGARRASPPPPSPRPQTRPDDANADLSITARVTADSVLFEKVPNPRVEFPGRPERVTVWEAERENLPPEVRPGVTYRNVGITLRIVSVFADIDRIVAEALGEVPAREEAQPAPQRPASPPAATPPALDPENNSSVPARRPARRSAVARTRAGGTPL